jgi:hypothetical protein
MSDEHESDGVAKFSPSALKTFKQCPRKWAASRFSGLPRVESAAQEDGTTLHTFAEAFLKDGTIPDQTHPMGRLMIEGIPHLPRPGTAETEHYFTRTIDGICFHGYIDFLVRLPVLIGDHKSSSDPQKWGLDAVSIFEDEQVNVYGFEVLEQEDCDEGEIRWVYYDKRRKRSYPVSVRLRRAEALEWIRKNLVPRAREMLVIREAIENEITNGADRIETVNAIANAPKTCDGVGRMCDFGQYCHIYPNKQEQIKMSTMAEKLAAIQAKRAAAGAGLPPEADKALPATAAEAAGEPEPAPQAEAPTAEAQKKSPGRPPKAKETTIAPPAASTTGVTFPSGSPLARLLAGQPVTLTIALS